MADKKRSKNGTSDGGSVSRASEKILVITPALLRRWPLPQPDAGGDKEERGRVLLVGGEVETPGAVILAGEASFRAGAGKVRVAVSRSIAQTVAGAVPEARVFALPETRAGALSAGAAAKIIEYAKDAQAVLVGPGMIDEKATARLLEKVLPRMGRATLILDAAAISCLKESRDILHAQKSQVVLTPNADEMAAMLGKRLASVRRDPLASARRAAKDWRAVVVLKGRETYIAAPRDTSTYCNRAGNVGLAASGSGDVLAGIIAGLVARGAEALQASVWGVYLHARAGDALAKRRGRLGFLARELAGEVPALMAGLGGRKRV